MAKRSLELSGNLPLNVSIRLLQLTDETEESFYEMHALLVEQVFRWKTLRVSSMVGLPPELRQWIPSELPSVVSLTLSIVVLEHVAANDTVALEPFISAPHLTFCASDIRMMFPLTYCPLLQEYHTMACSFNKRFRPPTRSLWRGLIEKLSQKCPQLEVLQVTVDSDHILVSASDVSPGEWPVLPSLTTLRLVRTTSSKKSSSVLTELKAPQLRRIEFLYHAPGYGTIREIQFPAKYDGRVLFSRIYAESVTKVLSRIPNVPGHQVELDLDSMIYGDPKPRKAETWEPLGIAPVTTWYRELWEEIRQTSPDVSWVVPSDEGAGTWKRLGGTDLSFDDAIAYLDRHRSVLRET
ncbi:hypothetical protein M407DRAFT_21094 [Tulasnella calospora MUT 4182]|uniref:F-box domain-containing protein n=1 Tax=Tulasnella calospora MUT 4182 TaxID=1051891 RepID=A0A0C3QNX1_9AGAM|nr:hypothetical protein M407DRAFT_21094 [Tulasnella calospora MUT 4182]